MKGASTGLPSPEAAVRRSYCSSATPWVSEENLHDRPVASKEIESVIKKSKMPQHRKLQSQMVSMVNSSSHIKNQRNLPLNTCKY